MKSCYVQGVFLPFDSGNREVLLPAAVKTMTPEEEKGWCDLAHSKELRQGLRHDNQRGWLLRLEHAAAAYRQVAV